MDCRTVLEQLESVGSDLADVNFATAVQHLRSCPRCNAVFQTRRQADEVIGRAMRDVPVPVRLKQRLLDQVTTADAAGGMSAEGGCRASFVDESDLTPARSVGIKGRLPGQRRRWIRYAAVAASIGVVGMSLWLFLLPRPARVSILELCQLALAEDLAELPPYRGHFEPTLPAAEWERLLADQRPRGLPDRDPAMPEFAVYPIKLGRARGRPIAGWLLVIPARHVRHALPLRFSDAETVYPVSPEGGQLAGLVWRSRRLAYVCMVEGSLDELKAIRRVVTVPPA